MTQLNYLTSGPADGTAATTGNTGATLVNTGTGGSSTWKNSVGAHGNTGVQQITITSGQSNAMRFPFAASNSKVQFTTKMTMPPSAPGAQYQLWSARYASGRMFSCVWETDGRLRTLDSANTPVTLAAAGVVALGQQVVFGVVADRVAGSYTVHVYSTSGTLLGTASVSSGAALTANDFTHLDSGGGTAVGQHGIVDLQMNDGAGSEIADYVPSTPLSTPVVTAGTVVQPSSSTATDGSQQVTWPGVTNAATYDARIAIGKTSPTEGDFVTVATGVSSPYVFTGLGAGQAAVGIRANP